MFKGNMINEDIKKRNIIGIEDTSVKIYRLYQKKYLKKTFNDNRLNLVKPKEWEDPFENILLKCKLRIKEIGDVGLSPIFECLYGQCWTLLKESDAFWRIYSHDKQGIKVETTIDNLFNKFFLIGNPNAAESYFIGKVVYYTENKLISWLTSSGGAQTLVLDKTGRGHAKSLLVKRDAFEHEQEVRLIYHEPSSDKAERQKNYQVRINPNDIFTKITLDPRLEKNEFERLRDEIKNWGYKNTIEKSNLYQSKSFIIKFKTEI